MKNKKNKMLQTIKSLESVIKRFSNTLMGDEIEDINYFMKKLKSEIKTIDN
jgi:hypothetical protein